MAQLITVMMNVMKSICMMCVILFVSCTSSKLVSDVEFPVLKHHSIVNASDYLCDMRVIPLSNKPNEAVINTMSKVCLVGEKIVVLDNSLNKVLLFDSNGQFMKSTEKMIGRGASEYIKLRDIAIDDTNGNIYVYCEIPNKLLIFDENLNLLESINMSIFTLEFTVWGKYAYFYCFDPSDSRKRQVIRYNKDNIGENGVPVVTTESTIQGVDILGYSLTKNGGCFFCIPFQNVMKEILYDGTIKSYSIDFEDDWKSLDNSSKLDLYDLQNTEMHWMLKNVYASDSLLLFNTNESGTFVVDRRHEKCHLYDRMNNDYIPFSTSLMVPLQSKEGRVAFLIFPSSIKNYQEKTGNMSAFPKSELKEVVESYKDDSNPLLILYKIR